MQGVLHHQWGLELGGVGFVGFRVFRASSSSFRATGFRVSGFRLWILGVGFRIKDF